MSILFGRDPIEIVQDFFRSTGIKQPNERITFILIDLDLSRAGQLMTELEQDTGLDAGTRATAKEQIQCSLGGVILSILSLGSLVEVDPIEGLAQAIANIATESGSMAFVCSDCNRLYFDVPPRVMSDNDFKCEDCVD